MLWFIIFTECKFPFYVVNSDTFQLHLATILISPLHHKHSIKYKKQVNSLTPVVKINYSHPLMLLEFVEHLGHVMLLEPFHLPTLFLSYLLKLRKNVTSQAQWIQTSGNRCWIFTRKLFLRWKLLQNRSKSVESPLDLCGRRPNKMPVLVGRHE